MEVLPSQLKIHFLSRTQTGSIFIRNGFTTPVEVRNLVYDQVTESPGQVGPGTIGKITLHYQGNQTRKDLRSQISFLLAMEYSLPVRYNYLSAGARGLLGLSPEQAEKLKREDSPRPRIRLATPQQKGARSISK